MFKLFFATVIAAAFSVQSASAGDCCCSDDTSSAVASTEHETKTAAGADQSEQAQRWNETRSYSYEPSYRRNYRRTIDGFYAGTINQDPRIIGSFGHRPASDKNIGKY